MNHRKKLLVYKNGIILHNYYLGKNELKKLKIMIYKWINKLKYYEEWTNYYDQRLNRTELFIQYKYYYF